MALSHPDQWNQNLCHRRGPQAEGLVVFSPLDDPNVQLRLRTYSGEGAGCPARSLIDSNTSVLGGGAGGSSWELPIAKVV